MSHTFVPKGNQSPQPKSASDLQEDPMSRMHEPPSGLMVKGSPTKPGFGQTARTGKYFPGFGDR